MKQENLDELKNIYLSLVTGGEGPEVLNETLSASAAGGGQAAINKLTKQGVSPGEAEIRVRYAGEGELKRQSSASATNKSLQSGKSVSVNTSAGSGLLGKLGVINQQGKLNSKGELEIKGTNSNFSQDKTIRLGGRGYNRLTAPDGSVKYVSPKGSTPLTPAKKPPTPAKEPPEKEKPLAGEPPAPAGEPPLSTAPRPTPSGPVLSKKDGVEGTGVGANFKARAFTDAEKTRYSNVAAQKSAIPTGTTAGGTKFERRTPTSAELGAAQASRAAGGSEEAAIKAGVNASKPVAPVGDKFGTTSSIKPLSSTEVKSSTPTTQFTKMTPTSPDNTPSSSSGETDRLKKALDIKKSDVNSSYEWSSVKTLKNIADAYSSVYEKKEYETSRDKDEDGDNDFADNMIARMVASGMSREEAIKKVKNKDYNIGEATAMSKRGLDEPEIRKEIVSKTKGGSFADKATALAGRETYGDTKKKEGREKLARKQRGDFRDTTSSNPGLHGYAYKATTDADKEKQAARGKQRGVLTPNEKKTLNREEVHIYDTIISHLLEYGFADTEEGADVIIENMSQSWIKQILSEG